MKKSTRKKANLPAKSKVEAERNTARSNLALHVQLKRIRLEHISAERNPLQVEGPYGEIMMKLNGETSQHENEHRLEYRITYETSVEATENKIRVPSFTITARFHVELKINADAPEITPDDIKVFGRIVVRNVWPYWCELVQSTTARMGLPSLSMPMVVAMQEVSDTPSATG